MSNIHKHQIGREHQSNKKQIQIFLVTEKKLIGKHGITIGLANHQQNKANISKIRFKLLSTLKL